MTQSKKQENFYAGRCKELGDQLQDVSTRYRQVLSEVRRAQITTDLIRKLYRLDYLKLGADELAGTFIDMAANALGAPRAAIFRRCDTETGFECLKARGFVTPDGPLLALANMRDGFVCSESFDTDIKLIGEVRGLTGARHFVWCYNRVSRLAV